MLFVAVVNQHEISKNVMLEASNARHTKGPFRLVYFKAYIKQLM